MQEQTGLSGPLILEPLGREPYTYQRDHVVMLTDWTDEEPMTVVSNLKQQSDYYNSPPHARHVCRGRETRRPVAAVNNRLVVIVDA